MIDNNMDRGHDLLTPSQTILASIESILKYCDAEIINQDMISDFNRIFTVAKQLSALIEKLCFKTNREKINLATLDSENRHKLRNQLGAILGYGEMLLEDISGTHSYIITNLQDIIKSVRWLLLLIQEFSPPVEYDDISAAPCRITASILLVDDDENNRVLLSRRLNREAGFKVQVAENGKQALDKIRNQVFDLILLDVCMPEMNGLEVLQVLKTDKLLKHIPVIMISALDEIDNVVHCIEMGAEDYLQKPYHQVILNAKISATLERQRLYDKSEKLLLNIFPRELAEQLKDYDPENRDDIRKFSHKFDEVTVLFSDLVGFTELAAKISAENLVEKLNQIVSAFDDLTKKHCLEKIKTIGDAYMLVGGLPTASKNHAETVANAEAVANLSLEMLEAVQQFNQKNNDNFKIRIGIHTGTVVAGVIGKNKFVYDLWGDTVNIASRMEQQGISNKIQISQKTYDYIKDKFIFKQRYPTIDVKGKGKMVTYFLTEIK